jgi:hypothetical protein
MRNLPGIVSPSREVRLVSRLRRVPKDLPAKIVLRPLRRGPVTARRVAVSKLCELRGARAGPYRFSWV